MTDERTRLDRAVAILDALEQPGSPSERVEAAMLLLDGFELTGASDEVRRAIESVGMKYNAAMQHRLAESPESDPELSDEDAQALVIPLRELAEVIRDAESERILARLRNHGGVLPKAEVMEMRRHRQWFIPLLMRECHDQIEKFKQLDSDDGRLPEAEDSSVPFFSLFLFSEWHVADSVPVILEGLQLPGEGPFELFGDAVHEQVPRYLAQFLSSDLDRIDDVVRNPRANLYARWCSAVSYEYMVRDRSISIVDAVARLDRLFEETKVVEADGRPGTGHCYELSAGILTVIDSVGGASRSTVLADDRNWEFVEQSIIVPDEFDEPEEFDDEGGMTSSLRRLPPTRAEDFLELLRHWASFAPKGKPARRPPVPTPRQQPEPLTSSPMTSLDLPSPPKPAASRSQRVSRNAPCPCGSGKKYKQCCLRKGT